MSQMVVRPLLDQRHSLVRGGVGGEIQIGRNPAEEEIPDRTADQRQFVAGVDESLPKLQNHRVHLEIDGVGVNLVMCVRHSFLSLSENRASTTPKAT